MKTRFMPIYVVLFLVGATALWYFGHHRPAQRLLKAEPQKIYKSTPLQPADSSVKPTPSDVVQKPREADTDIEVKGIDNAATPEKIDDSQPHSKNVDSEELASQEAISVDDPAAAEAFEKYLAAEAEYLAAHDVLKAALAARPIDWDRIESATNDAKNAARHRKEALENLAPYSQDAAKLLEAMKEAERQADERSAEFDAEMAEFDAEIQSLKKQIRDANDLLKESQDLPKAQ